MMMMMFPSGLFIFLTLVLLSYNHNLVTAQCTPSNLETTQVSSTNLTISWRCFDRDLDNELSASYYRRIDTGQCDKLGDDTTNTPSYSRHAHWGTWNRQVYSGDTYQYSITLTNLLPFSTWRVSVRARQPNGAGGYNYGTKKYISPEPTTISEAAPRSFGSESISYTPYADQLDFSWTIPCYSRNGVITGYQYNLLDVNNTVIITARVTEATSVTITGLSCDTTYRFYVAGINSEGTGPYSEYKTATTTCCCTREPPVDVIVTYVGQRSLSVTWMEPVCGERNGDSEITMYSYVLTDLYRDTSMSSTTSDTSVEFTDLTPYVQYAFKVSAWTSVGQGPFSNVIVNRTLEDRPTQPLNLVSSNANATSITIQWSSPDPPHGVIIGYEVQYWEGSGSTMTAVTTRNELTVSGLQVNDMVSFQVRAETGTGKGVWSKTVTAIAVEGVPGIPVNLTAIDIEETSVRLQWNSPMNSNGLIIDYPIKYKAIQKTYDSTFVPSDETYMSPSAMLKPDGSIHGYTVDNLSPSTKYEFLVAGRTSAGSGEYARIEVFTKAFTGLKRPDSPAVKIAKGFGIISFNNLPEFVSNVYITVENGNSRRRRQGGINPLHAFIVANLTRKEVDESMTFTVGDNKTYGGYVNHALIGGQSYGSKVAYATCTPEECLEEWSSLSIFTAPSGTFNQSGTINLLGPIVGGVVAVILVAVVLFALICCYRRNKASTKETPKETAKDENEIYDEIDPKKEMMAKQQQRSQTEETGYEVNMAMETKMSPRAQSDGSAYEDVNIKEEAEYQGLNLDAVDEEQTYQDLKGNASGDKSAPQYANV